MKNLLNDYVKQIKRTFRYKGFSTSWLKPPKEIPLFASDDDHVRKDLFDFHI